MSNGSFLKENKSNTGLPYKISEIIQEKILLHVLLIFVLKAFQS